MDLKTIVRVITTVASTFALLFAGIGAAQAYESVGPSFSGTLAENQAITNGPYALVMQDNGDLVLWENLTGRACWASGTRGPDVSATFHGIKFGAPYMTLNSPSQGEMARYVGAHTGANFGDSVSLNDKGEVWIGYRNVFSC